MFRKIQSYVTPILLSYVEKYIKDFKTEDTQVSLWGGSVSLHNLELRPDIIQQELNLPFSLSSGHIHELLIQVPWMKIVSEPIVVTINTIECVLKLIDGKQPQVTVTVPPKNSEELDAPPGYVQSLVNRIVSNIAFRCHNIILKYVEEDIVVSINIKQFHLDNVDGNWVPTFAEITLDDLHTRKLISLSDITLCLDKRNAAGKIETYLEPLLYKCELELRLDSTYLGVSNKRPLNTRISIRSPKLEFGFSYQQIPMILRITQLFLALKQKKLGIHEGSESSSDNVRHTSPKSSKSLRHDGSTDPGEMNYDETWSGWMWSFVQPFPLGYGEEQDSSLNSNPIILFSINFDEVAFSFKIPDIAQDVTGIYNNQRKFRYINVCSLKLKSVLCETSSHGFERFCFRGGVQHIVFYPENICACGANDVDSIQDSNKQVYYKSIESKKETESCWPIEYDSQCIVESLKEEEMLAVCPAFAFSYIYHLTIPEENKVTLNAIGTDLEYSNFREDITMNAVFGPFDAFICAGMIHRLSLIKVAADAYDYAPYYIKKPPIKSFELPPPTTDDYDALSEYVPKSNIKITAVKPKFHIAIWDHCSSIKNSSFYETSSGTPLINRRKVSVTAAESNVSHCEKLKNIGSILIEIETMTGSISNPMYPNRLTYVTCQLPDPPTIMLDACYKYNNLNITNMQCFLVHKAKKDKMKASSLRSLDMSCDDEDFKISYDINIPFITQCSFHLSEKHLLLKEYWLKNDLILHDDYNFNMENITVCGTLAKMLAAYHIFMSAFPQTDTSKTIKSDMAYSKSQSILMNTSMLNDAFGDSEMVHLDINFEGLSIRSVFFSEMQTHRMVLNAVKVFAIGSSKGSPDESNVKQVWIISAPESNSSLSAPLIKAVTQFSSSEQYLTFVTFKVEECSLVMDPLLCQWLTYSYQQIDEKSQTSSTPVTDSSQNVLQKRHSRRSLDEIVNRIGGSSRTLNRISLGQSSSDREKDYIHGAPNSTPQSNNNSKDVLQSTHKKEEPKQETHFFDSFIKKYFQQKNIAIYLELEIVTVYFPVEAVSALDFHLVSDAINESVSKSYDGVKRENVLILRLPSVLLKSSSLKQNLLPFCIYGLPVKLPSEVWDQTKISYPWTVAMKDFSCSTLSCCKNDTTENKIKETYILKPFSSDLTISFTPKMGKKKSECSKEKSVSEENKDPSVSVNLPKAGENQDITNLEKNNSKSNTKLKLNLTSPDVSKAGTDAAGCLTSIGICIHIDTEFVSVSLNQIQMILLNSIIHSNLELLNILLNIHTIKNDSNNVEDTTYNLHLVQDVNSFGRKQRNISNSDNLVDNLQEEDFSKDSDLVDSSCDIADVNKIDNTVEDNANLANQDVRKNTFTISAWIQWTVSRISMKAYASSNGDDDAKLKLVFAADDIVSSLDLQPEYLKWNMKVVTAGIHHYKRCSYGDPWELGNFCGIILKGRELIKIPKSSGDNCFLFVNVTRARCSSVHNKWSDMCKSKPKSHVSDNSFISEIEISLQALDIILNLQSLEPFTFLLSLLSNSSIKCYMNNMENNTFPNNNTERNTSSSIAKSWDSQKLALCYFEGYHTRIIMPVVSLCDDNNTENALILQIDQISLLPVADNPVCRSPLRPDLYQQAARMGFLNIPGSELEDRQCQFTLKGIGLYTTQWQQIENSYALDIQSQPTVSENPALQWNSTLSKQSSSSFTVNIMEKVDICMVLALAIFHHSELVCGPTIDVSIVSDIEIYLSIPQLKLVQTLTNEFSVVIEKIKEKMSISAIESESNSNEIIGSNVSVCPYYKYINNTVFIKHFKEANFNIERNTPTSVDTGIVSDMMSNFTSTSKGSLKYSTKTSNSSKNAIHRLSSASSSADYFDIFITFGKISMNIFEIFTSDVNFSSVIENTESKDDKVERTIQNFHSKPLLFAVFHQPNFSYSNHHFVTKSQFSIFHVSLSLGDDCLREGLPKSNDFLIALFETKLGTSDPISGISPAFLTVKCEKYVGKKDLIKIDIKCPIRITSSLDRILKLNKIKKLLLSSSHSKVTTESTSTVNENVHLYFEMLKKFLMSYSSIDLTMSQVVFAMIVQDQIDFELLLSFSSYKHSIALNFRPEKITNLGLIDSLVVSLRKTDDRQTKILINPWTIGFDVNIIWEMWQNMEKSSISPLIRIFIQTDRLLIDLSPEHIKILLGVFNYWNSNNALKESPNQTIYTTKKAKENIIGLPCLWNQVTAYDQHYKDDLRAGAFKFIHGGTGYPLAYQVFIGLNGLVWRYPQPRAITRVHSFPVPFHITNESEKKISLNESVVCTLEYYCDITNSFHYYAKFYIKQDDRVKLDYSKFDHCTVLSSMWRVVMHLNDGDITQKRTQRRIVHFDKELYCSFDSVKSVLALDTKELSFPVRPQALAACLRIDSYFTPNLIPKFQIAIDVSSAELNLYNNYRQRSLPPLIDSLKLFKSDGCVPTPHIFCTIALISTHLQSSIWDVNTAMFKFDSDISCDVINDGDMLLDRIVDCTDTSINLWKGEGYDDATGSLIHARQLNIRGGPQHAHMLHVSYKLWQDIISSSVPPAIDDVVKEKQICSDCANMKADMMITKYLICNDTNMSLKFGQIETEENIILESRKCHLYSWRMPNKKNLLRLTVNLGNWKFSEGICIEKAGITTIQLKHQNDLNPLTIIVLVENSSPAQLCVTFMGQLIIMNVLPNKFNMKLYHKKVLQLHGLSGSPTVSVDAGVRSPSLLFDTSTESAIRLHFADSDSGWSGDIPLIECSKGNMPWLVKVPVKGEIQYISIWCRITKDNVSKRTLVTLSPLYILRSHLPTNISVKLHTEKYSQPSVYSVDGKGSTHFITTPGITETKHELLISNIESTNLTKCDNKIPLHYDMVDQLTFFPNKEDVVNIDAILLNMKQWTENSMSECEWPYIFSEDGLQWNPIGHQHSTDIVVRYLPAIRSIDSMVVDMAPWALFGNCSGLSVNLHGPNREELCTVNHREVIIPPPVIMKESFFCRVNFTSETYLSGPLHILSTALGPYERKPQGCISYEGTSTFTVDCNQSVCVFSMAYEIKQNINIFRLSSNYVFINQLPQDIMVLPIAMHLSMSNIYLPQNATEMSITIPSAQNSCIGVPINKFHVLSSTSANKSKDNIDDDSLLLYIYLRYSLDSPFSCPIRIDKFTQRKSISVKSNSKSIPVVLSCQEYRGQVYITAHKDTSPQFLIMNKANITITIAQVLKEFVTTDTYNYDTKNEFLPKNVVEECWNSDWHCTLQPGEQTYYTMPMQSIQYPELFTGTSSGFEDNLYLTFAYVKNNECNSYTWSVPVDVGTNSLEKFVKLPGYVEDIKVMVNSHCFATTVIVNNVTQDDISASDIRQRLLISIPTEIVESSLENELDFSSKSPEVSNLAEKDYNFETTDSQSDQGNMCLLENAYSANTESSPSFSFNDSKLGTFLKMFKITSVFDNVNICMIMNKEANEGLRSSDIFSLICDSVVGTCSPSNKGFVTRLTIGDLQIDNPLFPNGGFDFHVVIIKQASVLQTSTNNSIDWKPLIGSQICSISKVVDALRQNCLFKCEINMEIWEECSVTYSGLYDLQITIGPISLYLEDTYISTLLDYFTDFVPISFPTTCSHVNNLTCQDSNDTDGVTFVSIPEYIIWEGSAIAHPIKFKKLLIHPLNILLSLHSSMVLYIALDHSPLQFAKFERINVLTSSYRLGHALTMHYLSEAIFGAGWVVGSLEILGSPGGLARRVSAGLRDLVREPCRGLMRGPWGFVVGMTHGSASLLKHLTQGTVESMSMVMGSVARNLDRLSLDEDHMRRTERARRHRPEGLVQALTRGLQGLGLSLLGAIGGIAHEALVVGYEKGGSPVAVAAGLTRGLMGVITKPLSATADFLALTGQGLLCQAGWDQHPTPRWIPLTNNLNPSKNENFRLKLGNTFACSSLLYICQGINRDTGLNVTIVITNKWVILLDTHNDKVIEMVELDCWRVIKSDNIDGELVLGLKKTGTSPLGSSSNTKLEPELQMDPALRARIAAYVGVVEDQHLEEKLYRLTLSSQHSSHCAAMILFARLHSLNQGFPVL